MRICADCSGQIHKHDKWRIDGSRIRHINCLNPRLIEARLPLWQDRDPLAPVPEPEQKGEVTA